MIILFRIIILIWGRTKIETKLKNNFLQQVPNNKFELFRNTGYPSRNKKRRNLRTAFLATIKI